MRLSTLFSAGAGVLLVAAAACHKDSSAPTQPVVVTPPAATPTSGGQPKPTPTPGSTTMRVVNVGPGNLFMDSQSNNSTTTIKTGDTVQWNFVDSISHSTTSGSCCTPSGLWDSGVKSSGSFSHQFPAAGTFPYYCTVHGAMMTGTVVVNP